MEEGKIYRHYGSRFFDKERAYEQPTDGSFPSGLWGVELDKLPLLKEEREKEPDALTEEVGGIVDRLCGTVEDSQGAEKNYFDFRLRGDARIYMLSVKKYVDEAVLFEIFAKEVIKGILRDHDGMCLVRDLEDADMPPFCRQWPEYSIVVWNLDVVVPVGEEGDAGTGADGENPAEAAGQPLPQPALQEPGYVGHVGERIVVKAAAICLATTWRTGRLYLIEDTDGNVFTCKTRRTLPVNIEPGTVTLRARVKNHAEYRGTKQNWVERVRVI